MSAGWELAWPHGHDPPDAAHRPRAAPNAGRPYLPGYDLPKSRPGMLPWTWAKQRLKRSHSYSVVTVSPEAILHAKPVWGCGKTRAFYFGTGARLHNARNFARSAWGTEEGGGRGWKARHDWQRCSKNSRGWSALASANMTPPRTPAWGPLLAVRPRMVFGLNKRRFLAGTTCWMYQARGA